MKMLEKHLGNMLGWKTERKIVVFEIDDYGTTRVSNKEDADQLKNSGIKLDFFSEYDRMESPQELNNLLEILLSVKDKNGSPAVFTPLVIVANPDFNKIEDSDFKEYIFEPFTKTLDRSFGPLVFDTWKKGIENRVFKPQFHGREHFNVQVWMQALKDKKSNARKAFSKGICGVFDVSSLGTLTRFGAAFDYFNQAELNEQKTILVEGINLFDKIFGYRPVLFTPPNSRFPKESENEILKEGIRFMTVSKKRIIPCGSGVNEVRYNFFGKENNGLIYTPRNCLFEPHSHRESNWVDACLRDIKIAFTWKKPAIISGHRINFVNQQDSHNGNGLSKLSQLLKTIVKIWPEVEFMSSDDLYRLVK